MEPGNIRLCKIIMYSQRYYTLFFPGCQGPEENIYSSSGKFHTVSWREPSRPSTRATAWLPRGTRLGTPVMASARAFRSWMSTTGRPAWAQLTGQLRPLGFTAIPRWVTSTSMLDPGVEIQVTRSVTMGSRAPDQEAPGCMVSLAPGGSVGVPPGTAHETAVGVCVDIDVKVCVNFRGAQDDHVQTVHHGAPGAGTCIMVGGNFPVPGIVPDGGHGVQVKALHVHELAEAPGTEHLHQVAGDAAQGEAAVDVLRSMISFREAAAAREAPPAPVWKEKPSCSRPEAWMTLAAVSAITRPTGSRVIRGGTGEDALGVANGLHLYHIVHQVFGDGPVRQGIGQEGVRQDNDLLGVGGVRYA